MIKPTDICGGCCEAQAFITALRYFKNALLEAANALDEASDDVESWGAYAGDYFAEKHDLRGTAERIRNQARSFKSIALEGRN